MNFIGNIRIRISRLVKVGRGAERAHGLCCKEIFL